MSKGKIIGLSILGFIVAVIIGVIVFINLPRSVFRYVDNNDGTSFITGRRNSDMDGTLRIPNKIAGQPITCIGSNAFRDFDYVTKVVIPDGITRIDSEAFVGCDNIKKIKFGKDVTYIGSNAFDGVRKVTEIELPYGLEIIENEAFCYCSHLEKIYIPATVKKIGSGVFLCCWSLNEVIIDENNQNYKSVNGSIYTKDGKTLVHFNQNQIIDGVATIPEGVTTIMSKAFKNCSKLKEIVIPNSVEVIDEEAFYECSQLEKVVLGSGVKAIGNEAFYKCAKLASITGECEIEEIGAQAFCYCVKMTEFPFNDGLKKIGYNAFAYSSIKTAKLPSTVESIGYGAFDRCEKLEKLVVPSTVVELGSKIVNYCPSLVYNEYENGCYLGDSANPYAFLVKAKSKDITTVKIHENTRIICEEAFKYCGALERVTIPKSVEKIDNSAFYCSGIKTLVINNGAQYIGSGAFKDCKALERVILGNNVKKIDREAFAGCILLESIILPTGLDVIGNDAFKDCVSLKSEIVLYKESVISACAFEGCTSLESVKICKDVAVVYTNAFKGCTNLTIKCEMKEVPSAWSSTWNGGCPFEMEQ